VSQYQKGKTNLDFTEARDSEWQWHQMGRMQVSTSTQTEKPHQHLTTQFFTSRMHFMPPNQQCQSTESIQYNTIKYKKKSFVMYAWSAGGPNLMWVRWLPQ